MPPVDTGLAKHPKPEPEPAKLEDYMFNVRRLLSSFLLAAAVAGLAVAAYATAPAEKIGDHVNLIPTHLDQVCDVIQDANRKVACTAQLGAMAQEWEAIETIVIYGPAGSNELTDLPADAAKKIGDRKLALANARDAWCRDFAQEQDVPSCLTERQ